MNQPAIDAYLDELLDLTVETVAPAPVAANAPAVEPIAAKVEIPPELLAELDSDPLFAGQPATHAPVEAGIEAAVAEVPSAAAAVEIPADLLAELDSDPLFAAQAPQAASAAPAISADLLAELDSDPLFGTAPTPTPAASAAIPHDLLAELDSDPLFAAALTPTPAASTAIPHDLLAELDSDPLFGAATEAPKPAAPHPAPVVAQPPAAPVARPVAAAPVAAKTTGLRPMDLTPPALPPSVTTTHRWLRVAVGLDSYAVELLRVQEVGRTAPIVAMRGAAPSVLGAMNLRGRIVPVFDLGLWLGTGAVVPDERARIVVVERDNELIGALVSAVDDVVTLGPERIEPPLMASPSRAIVGVARVTAKPTVLLDANALFG
ncbi:chemotaxis protein CheW [Lysobacter sp.]|uniref:chemotaxis protein CheW n=1 Tax=Lysobacter sp. TaxID=72226 RepID=UPI002D69F9FB|nr:chemotaxis protein CheW [Lysobacter sp.]HZX78831.1 chemotaxis protein CheW [Lysobacter sp.]